MGAAGIGFLSEGYRSVWLCVWRFCSFVCVVFGMPIARGAGIFSGSGQRLIFLILFFLLFSFVGIFSVGFFFYILFGSCGVCSISISVWGLPGWWGGCFCQFFPFGLGLLSSCMITAACYSTGGFFLFFPRHGSCIFHLDSIKRFETKESCI